MMPVRHRFAIFPLVAVVAASVRLVEKTDAIHNDKLTWEPCTDPEMNTPNLSVMCAELKVPLNYIDLSSTETLTLKLMKYPAAQEPHLGSILINFGGPGSLGRRILAGRGETLLHITGGQHDLITWDPRGTIDTLPFDCFKGSQAKRARDDSPRDIKKRLPDTRMLEKAWSGRGELASLCESNAAREGSLIGTAYSARDMLQIIDALDTGEGGLLRYWGFSAGSRLGATFVAMFPDRADRIVIDGVENAHAITHALGNPESLSSVDKLVTNIINACTQLPDGCPLAKSKAESVSMIQRRLLEAFVRIWRTALTGSDGRKLHWSLAKKIFFNGLYYPPTYPRLITGLAGLLNDDAAPMFEMEKVQEQGRAFGRNLNSLEGIRCGDQKSRSAYLFSEEAIEIIDEYRANSFWFGQLMSYSGWMFCAQWKINAKERYEGDFQVETALKGPGMLVIGNSFDPITPWVSAQNMSASLRNSVLLNHNGHGHTSLAQRSDCTENIIRKYFTEGLLPQKGTVCEPNKDLVEYLTPSAESKMKRDDDSLFLM